MQLPAELWLGITLNPPWLTKQRKTTEDNMPAQTNIGPTETPFQQDFPITNILLKTPTRDSVSMFRHFAGSRVII